MNAKNFNKGSRHGGGHNRAQNRDRSQRSEFESKVFTGNGEGLTQDGQELVRKLIVDGDSLALDRLASGLAEVLRNRQLSNSQLSKVSTDVQKLRNRLSLRELALFKSTLSVIGARQARNGGQHLATLLSAMVDQMIAFNDEEVAKSRFNDNFVDFFKALMNYATEK